MYIYIYKAHIQVLAVKSTITYQAHIHVLKVKSTITKYV